MINEALLQKKIGDSLIPSQNSLEIKERVLMAKWVSFTSLHIQVYPGEFDSFLHKRKIDLAHFYQKNLHVAKSLEAKIDARSVREEAMHGDASDELGFFLGGFCSRISFWSRLLRQVCSSNFDLAAKETLFEIQKTAVLDSDTRVVMGPDISSALQEGGTIIGPLDAMLACQQALLPAIKQPNLSLRQIEGEEDLYTSSKITPLPQLKVPKTISEEDNIIASRLHSDMQIHMLRS